MVNKYFSKSILIVVAFAIVILGYWYFFPSLERQVKNRLRDLASTASFENSPAVNSGQITAALFADRLGNYFDQETTLEFSDLEGDERMLTGRSAVRQAALALRSQFSAAEFEVVDLQVIKLDESASQISATLKFSIQGSEPRPDISAQELLIDLTRPNDEWLILKIKTISVIQR